ncbi:hypothetical protein KUTeg_005065 [Tegillarca granosa]|uniref:DDRGK domain-containing protein 1 n=1 Tax=Tegillarca granosa TaxID=220873 RepID=A0ABQ9FKG9_TEGGR|nr:hypothetical protein KUTeg_005065 [Tegillarca granosa]
MNNFRYSWKYRNACEIFVNFIRKCKFVFLTMAAVDPSTVYLVLVSIIVLIMIIVSIVSKYFDKKDERPERQAAVPRQPEENVRVGGRRQGPRRRMRVQGRQDRDDSGDEYMGGDGDDLFDKIEQPEGKIEEEERRERKEREALLEKQRKKEEEKRKQEEAEREEEERKRKEEEEKREHEEYLKLKEAFSVEEEGECDISPDLTSQSLLQEFIDHIKESKVVMLEDLAAQFKIRTQDAINRVQELQEDGRLTGVIDDRGKFIYIPMEELEAVAKFIRQHGRISISELAESSNRLINLNPDTTATQRKLLQDAIA